MFAAPASDAEVPMKRASSTTVTPAVGLSQRYTAAWSEIGSRVSSRQQVNVTFATASVAVASALFGFAVGPNSVDAAPWAINIADGFAIGLVALTWAFVLWVGQNDAIIGLLGVYCRELECIDDPALGFPAWHTHTQGWMPEVLKHKRKSDYATLIIILFNLTPAAVLTIRHYCAHECGRGGLLLGVVVAGLSAALWQFRSVRMRASIAAATYKGEGGSGA
jgi:hypothetical protein